MISHFSFFAIPFSCPHEITSGINPQEDEKQDGEAPEGRTSVAEKWQGNAYHGRKAEHHAHVYEHVEQENAQYAIAVNASELERLALRKLDEAQY